MSQESADLRGNGSARVLVAMLTYRRPTELARALPAVVAEAESCELPASVVVVDNDTDGGAEAAVKAYQYRSRVPVRYVHEPRPGISAARNAALAVGADHDVLVFIDDDELPSPGWLTALTQYWLLYRPAAVAGPVVSTFDRSEADTWVVASGAFEERTFATGTRRQGASSSNLLLDMRFLESAGLTFDDRLGLVGGEDTLLTHQLVAAGGQIHWCADAAVIEPVPPERLSRRWVLRRAYRSGSSWAHAELAVRSPLAQVTCRASILVRGSAHLAADMLKWSLAVLSRREAAAAQALRAMASHSGMISGVILGARMREYRR